MTGPAATRIDRAPLPEAPGADGLDRLGAVAATIFGAALATAELYAASLATTAIERGLLGPREAPRIWDRHVLNGAALAELVPPGSHVLDIGAGAGLPGIPLALARPDLQVTLLDSQLRRVRYLEEVVAALGVGERVQVVRARVEEHRATYDVLTGRAVAALDIFGRWSAGCATPGAVLLAVRGARAPQELAVAGPALGRAGWRGARVVTCGDGLPVATTVVHARRR